MFICDNIGINAAGNLTFAGKDTVEMAGKYGTPLYLMDENKIRSKCRVYKESMKKHFGGASMPLYASKALCFKRMYEIMREEGMGIDIVSSGELYTAVKAGFPLENAYFHGNNKTDRDIEFAMGNGIGYFVADNQEELEAIEAEASKRGKVQKILLRITPGIDPHTHKAIVTGNIDSKFGSAIGTGQAKEIVGCALSKEHIRLCGFHCHIGSQIFEPDPFIDAAGIMLDFIADMKSFYGYEADKLNLGGGFGVRYLAKDPEVDYDANIRAIAEVIKKKCSELGVKMPDILMEPGRSIVADAGMTLYTVGSVKQITGFKNYVSVDGGMPDNPRYALYESPYTVITANKASEKADFICSVAGRCCESGDLIQENISLQRPERGDVLAVLTTGAYNYSMASNYNRIPRPPVIMIDGDNDYTAVRRESFENLTENDI